MIRELIKARGAYIIVSGKASLTDKPLRLRREAMRDALSDVSTAADLHIDFYDRDRLATWVNEYPAVVEWVRGRLGRALTGWSSIGDWQARGHSKPKPYLSNDALCLIDEQSTDRTPITVVAGVARLREALRTPRQCIRLVGLSGVGKTRLVEALFERGFGSKPLDPSLAIYTDYSVEPTPTARDMARELIARRRHAILIVDNCNPAAHAELAALCASGGSEITLITVEYDVGADAAGTHRRVSSPISIG